MWQWFDEIAHRWCSYSTEDSAAMEKAYQAAEPSVKYKSINVFYCYHVTLLFRVSSGRQRYVVQFGPMMQVRNIYLRIVHSVKTLLIVGN